MSEKGTATFAFRVRPTDPTLTADDLRRILATEVANATNEMSERGQPVDARLEMEGAFGGVGETLVLLLLATTKGAVTAIGAAAGKLFFDSYLKPRLQKRNLIVSPFEDRNV